MKKYIIKHIDTDFLKGNSMYLNYSEKDGWKRFVLDVNQATRFEGKSNARNVLKKLNHPENWIIVGVLK